MATRAYNESYLANARDTLATMLDYAVNYQGQNPDIFFAEFIASGIADQFGYGHPMYIMGKTGVDLYFDVKGIGYINSSNLQYQSFNRSPAYWVGNYLAFAQWYLCRSFRDIVYAVSISEMLSWYNTDHEADVTRFAYKIEERVVTANTNLTYYRKKSNLSQTQLANLSGVPIRNIQAYEQGVNDITKSSYTTLANLSRVLQCDAQDLVRTIDFKQRLLNEYQLRQAQLQREYAERMRQINEDYQIKRRAISQRQMRDNQFVTGYIKQFPYDRVAFYDNNYYTAPNVVYQNQMNYVNNNSNYNEEQLKVLKEAFDVAGEIIQDKKIKATGEVLEMIDSQNIIERLYHALKTLDEISKK